MAFIREPSSAARARVDRFVLPRASLPESSRQMAWASRAQTYEGEIWSTKYLKQKKYMKLLDEAFGLAPLKSQPPKSQWNWSWPCLPRTKNYLSSADSVLDLPTYSSAIFPQLLDWSGDDILVAALGRNYHKWSWHTQSTISRGFTYYNIQCCKFDARGEHLLLGTDAKTVEVHSNEHSTCLYEVSCKCPSYCSITAIDWSPTGNSFVTGCSQGMICAMSKKSYVIQSQSVFKKSILVVKISPNARLVATAGLGGHGAIILTWPDLTLFSILPAHETVLHLTWHPWRSALLGMATADGLHSRIAVWEAGSGRYREERIGRGEYSVDAMLFNHRTGELVLSLWNLATSENETTPQNSQIVVMSDFDTVVDHWGEGPPGMDRVRTMIFSPDGTKLATATADEDLFIWNFLPKDYKKMKNCKNFSALPRFLDKVGYGYTLR